MTIGIQNLQQTRSDRSILFKNVSRESLLLALLLSVPESRPYKEIAVDLAATMCSRTRVTAMALFSVT